MIDHDLSDLLGDKDGIIGINAMIDQDFIKF